MEKVKKKRTITYPTYDNTVDIEVLNENFRAIVEDIEELEIGKKDTFEEKSGFNLDKTDSVENNQNKLFTAKGALDLKNWIVEAYTNAINTTKATLESLIGNKLNHGGYSGSGQTLKQEIDTKEPKISKKSGFNLDKSDIPENNSNKLATAKALFELKN